MPTPFLVGRVNCYLIEDEPLTLVDTGPNSGKSLDELEQALAEHGRAIEDLELIVLTHQHMDHIGLLEILARRSGAEVAALHLLGALSRGLRAPARLPTTSSPRRSCAATGSRRRSRSRSARSARRSGRSAPAARSPGRCATATRSTLRDRTLRVLHRPGHSPSDTVFWDEIARILIGGDHCSRTSRRTRSMTRPLDGGRDDRPGRRRWSSYIESLRATRELPARIVLGGHGEPVVDHVALIDERLRMHRKRARKMLRLLDAGPMTAYEIAVQMWGNVAVTQAFLTLSEVLGHMDVLVNEGQAVEREDGDIVRFHAGLVPLAATDRRSRPGEAARRSPSGTRTRPRRESPSGSSAVSSGAITCNP